MKSITKNEEQGFTTKQPFDREAWVEHMRSLYGSITDETFERPKELSILFPDKD